MRKCAAAKVVLVLRIRRPYLRLRLAALTLSRGRAWHIRIHDRHVRSLLRGRDRTLLRASSVLVLLLFIYNTLLLLPLHLLGHVLLPPLLRHGFRDSPAQVRILRWYPHGGRLLSRQRGRSRSQVELLHPPGQVIWRSRRRCRVAGADRIGSLEVRDMAGARARHWHSSSGGHGRTSVGIMIVYAILTFSSAGLHNGRYGGTIELLQSGRRINEVGVLCSPLLVAVRDPGFELFHRVDNVASVLRSK